MGKIPTGLILLVGLLVLGVSKARTAAVTTLNPVSDDALVITTVSPNSVDNFEVSDDSPLVTLEPSSAEGGLPTESPIATRTVTKPQKKDVSKPEIRSFQIHSNIRYRYCRTYVTSRVANPNAEQSQEVTFRVVLPETAFISKFTMEIDGKPYEAYVKEKEQAKKIYNEAQSQGQSAGLVELNTRNSNVFNVNVNVKAQSKVNFNLTYEELLSRRLGRYEQSINISPEQFTNVKDFQVTVNIEESQNITLLRVPQLRNDVDAQQDEEGNIQDVIIERQGNKANITWKPSEKEQTALAKQGQTGRLIVEYDIARELDAGEVLVMNGYFVHFFAPANLAPLRKHVVFILDISGSMWGRKMEQLKEAMNKILADLTADDFFNIITFSSDVNLWGPDDKVQQNPTNSWAPPSYLGENSAAKILNDASKRQPFPATKDNIGKAQNYINALVATGGTNIHDAIVQALNLTSLIKTARRNANQTTLESSSTSTTTATTASTTTVSTSTTAGSSSTEGTVAATTEKNQVARPVTILPAGVESLIIFLTDGEPTVGITNPTQIQTLIQAANKNESVPLFSLAFGEGADFPFVKKLSLQNNGFARKIYEASDATIQLTGFYSEIASPLLSNVTFNYTSPDFDVANLTTTKFATVFGGTEIAVCGTLIPKPPQPGSNDTEAEATTTIPTPTSEIPRLEDSIALPKSGEVELIPTNEVNFDVLVNGVGRAGVVEFVNPEIFSSPIPWGVPVIRPWPPRPTPPPTLEDTFLEKLWAYLTIKQLIDKDLATIGKENEITEDDDQLLGSAETTTAKPATTTAASGNLTVASNGTITKNCTVVKETPKQRALRLALKYGFVTPLTSLVVVKPNETDVTNAVPSDVKPDVADSMSSPQSLTHNYANVHLKRAPAKFTANRISGANFALVPLSLQAMRPASSSFPGGFPGAPGPFGFGPASFALPPQNFAATSFVDYEEAEVDLSTISLLAPSTPRSKPPRTTAFTTSTTPATTTTTTTASPSVTLTLQNLTWLSEDKAELHVNETTVLKIARNETDVDLSSFVKGVDCEIEGKNTTGTCQHLRDCVQQVFVADEELYKSTYLCRIDSPSSSAVSYAGACCPKRPRS
ncbi:unnamed protein product [Allacma fusca]|uniref:Inter-alpha-trypsin inhibitor heavy chain H4 n=1 Tax=Allacma fusca TaxID=39272 RepID=A0A8J2JZH6_9HEXA|nr:unnamed protein product [Allacma fusca]